MEPTVTLKVGLWEMVIVALGNGDSGSECNGDSGSECNGDSGSECNE
jgi:hypothetical protein